MSSPALAHAPADGQAVEVGQPEVEDERVGRGLRQCLERLAARGHGHHVVALEAEGPVDRSADGRVVVDHQDAHEQRTYRRAPSGHGPAACLTSMRRSPRSGVVQSAERRPLEPDVGGSSPPPGARARPAEASVPVSPLPGGRRPRSRYSPIELCVWSRVEQRVGEMTARQRGRIRMQGRVIPLKQITADEITRLAIAGRTCPSNRIPCSSPNASCRPATTSATALASLWPSPRRTGSSSAASRSRPFLIGELSGGRWPRHRCGACSTTAPL